MALTHLQVVDVVTGKVHPDRTILIEGGRILAVARDGAISFPPDTRVLDGGQRFVIPGLWDMHVHTTAVVMRPAILGERWASEENAPFVFPLFIANGVTGVRDMSGNLAILRRWKSEIAAGRRLGPRMIITGGKLGGARPVVPGAPYPLETAADVQESVRLLKAGGADFVKYLTLPPELNPALFEAARESGLPVVGHIPAFLSAVEVSDMGMKGIEHMNGILLDGSSHREEVIFDSRQELTWWGRLLIRLGIWDAAAREIARRRILVNGYHEPPPRGLFQRLKGNGTWQTPTLSAIQSVHGVEDQDVDLQHREAYILPFLTGRSAAYPGGDSLLAEKYVRIQFELVGLMAREGIPLLAGSDMPGTCRLPGFSLVDELERLVRAGLTPLQALQAATVNPAEFLGGRDSLGTIERGRVADLVLLDANPIEEITNLRHVQGVVVAGRYLSREDLDGLLSGVADLVRDWREAASAKSASSSGVPGNNH